MFLSNEIILRRSGTQLLINFYIWHKLTTMRNKLCICLFAALAVFNFTACDTEPIDPNIVVPDPSEPTETGNFQVKIDGQQYTALTSQAYISGGAIMISAVRANGDAFAFVIGGNTAGTYAANQNILSFIQGGSQSGWYSINPANPGENTGSVVISSVNTTNHTITGTFQFTGYWEDATNTGIEPKEFTEGTFTVPYSDPPQNPSEDTFSAMVDGAAFNPANINAQETVSGSLSVIQIAALNQNATLSVIVESDIALGNHAVTDGSLFTDGFQIMYMSVSGNGGGATSGNLNIVEKTSDRIKGTFSVTIEGTGTYEITQGAFDVAY